MGFLSSLLGTDVGKATQNALGQNNTILTNLQGAGNQIINTGEQKSAAALNRAVDNYNPYLQTGSAATSMYGNALGLNGAEHKLLTKWNSREKPARMAFSLAEVERVDRGIGQARIEEPATAEWEHEITVNEHKR